MQDIRCGGTIIQTLVLNGSLIMYKRYILGFCTFLCVFVSLWRTFSLTGAATMLILARDLRTCDNGVACGSFPNGLRAVNEGVNDKEDIFFFVVTWPASDVAAVVARAAAE